MPSLIERFRQWRLRLRQYYMLDPDELRPGDIIFSTERAMESFFIRFFTRSKYSHAAIYLGDGLYAEAVDVGVRTAAVTTIVKERLKVIRLKGGAQKEEVARAAAGRINHYLHLPYAPSGAALSVAKQIPSADPRALFCSQLVSRAYADVNVAVVPGHEPEKITPEMLATSPLFEDITTTATFATRAVPVHLVSGAFETLGDRETAIVEKMYRELLPFFVERAITPPRDWIGMLAFLSFLADRRPAAESTKKLDLAVMKAMESSGYVDHLGAARDVVVKLVESTMKFDPFSFSNEQAALHRFSFSHNLKALQRQAEIDLDNQRFWAEQFCRSEERGDAIRSFRALATYHETQHRLRQETIKLTGAAIEKLTP